MNNLSFDNLPNAVEKLGEDVAEIKQLILQIQSGNSTQPIQQEELFNIKQASEFLGFSVSTLYRYSQNAQIPVLKQSNRLYFPRGELLEWLKLGRKKTLRETAIEANNYRK